MKIIRVYEQIHMCSTAVRHFEVNDNREWKTDVGVDP